MKVVIKKLLLFLSISVIFVTMSELWFYRLPPENNLLEIVFAYGLVGYLFLIILDRFKVYRFAGFFVAAGMFGFLIEGIPVPVLYSLIPFSILWTSLAWHALISIGIGWYWFRQVMTAGSWQKIITYNSALGAGLGIWGGYFWNVVESETGDVTGWLFVSPTVFAEQFMFGWLLFTLGHILFGLVTKGGISFARLEIWGISIITTVFFLLLQLIPAFPLSLLLPVLVGISVLALRKDRSHAETTPILHTFTTEHIPLARFLYTLFIPLGAIGIYTLIYSLELKFEANVLLILTAGPLALWWWLRSMWQLFSSKN